MHSLSIRLSSPSASKNESYQSFSLPCSLAASSFYNLSTNIGRTVAGTFSLAIAIAQVAGLTLPIKIIVFGATGGTGKNIVEQGLSRGYRMTAFIHKKRGLEGLAGLSTVTGDVLNREDVEKAVADQDAVISALGAGKVSFDGTRNIVDAMKKAGVRRLIV